MIVMDLQDFARRLRRPGNPLATWPERERRAALRLLRFHPAARRALDSALDADAPAGDEAAALARMQAGLQRRLDQTQAARRPAVLAARYRGASQALRAPSAPRTMGWAALAASALLGAWLGSGVLDQGDRADLMASLQVSPLEIASR
jgi:hypothetical protein